MKTTVNWPEVPVPPPATISIELDQADAMTLRQLLGRQSPVAYEPDNHRVASQLITQLSDALSEIRQHFFPRES
jgi:hypothetical protein